MPTVGVLLLNFLKPPPTWTPCCKILDAALLIGDPALRLAILLEGQTRPDGEGANVCSADATGVEGAGKLFIYDMVEEWQRHTNLPAVLAVWAARNGVVNEEVLRDFAVSRDFGLAHIPEISEVAAFELRLPAPAMAAYLRENIDYSLDAANQLGLETFFSRAAALGLIDEHRDIAWAGAAALRQTVAKS